MNRFIPLFIFLFPLFSVAQKKPLDHTVYDGWQSIGERMVSNNGKWVVYTVNVQEGDGELVIQSIDGKYKKQIPRGYNALITEDSRFAVLKIRPKYKETREARIKKKRPEEMPKDSFAIVELGKDAVTKIAKVRSYKTPSKAFGWVAYHKDREPAPQRNASTPTQKTVDSLKKTIDSLIMLVTEIKNVKSGSRDLSDADEDPSPAAAALEGTDLILKRLSDGKDITFKNVSEYYFNPFGQKLLMKITRSSKDSFSRNGVVMYDLEKGKLDTISKGGNDFRNFAFTEDGTKAAFLAERDTAKKVLQKYYHLYLYKNGDDSASLLLDKNSNGMQVGMTVSENGNLNFSKSGKRLFFGTAPIQPAKDTSLVDIDLVKVDVWHYNDDYLQTQQLFNLNNELKRSYSAVYDFDLNKIEQLASKELQIVMQTAEGDGNIFYAATDTGRRVAAQWSGQTKKDIYSIDVKTGERKLIKRNHSGQIYPSSSGKYLLLYDAPGKNYWAWDGKTLKNITAKIKVPLYDEENDVPNDPGPYGLMGWHQNDSFVYINDKYDIWKVDPTGVAKPEILNISGRPKKITTRYVRTNPEERFITNGQLLHVRMFDNIKKASSYAVYDPKQRKIKPLTLFDAHNYNGLVKAEKSNNIIFTKENYKNPANIFTAQYDLDVKAGDETQLSSINQQQSQYNWGTAELYKWKAFNGKEHTGILYKPENFDSTKKYPMIMYFYETHSDELNNYIAPAPTPSRLNIPFYVSRGYIVFSPDIIYYTKGHPAKDAYNSVVSAAQSLAKKKWIDAKNIAIQGQSWGGIQVAQLITMTNMFKAAWAGAPVANMTSAYGGIRWEGGINRQFQYEKTQSRIGATLWERPDLYIANSPLFHLPKVKTPLVIMANDADGAVPWYQGIELFTGMRRLGKQVWMLNYNGEAHNLVERKNRKDIQIRQQQFFDWLLKGEKPAKWITDGVPATKKGKEWGLEL